MFLNIFTMFFDHTKVLKNSVKKHSISFCCLTGTSQGLSGDVIFLWDSGRWQIKMENDDRLIPGMPCSARLMCCLKHYETENQYILGKKQQKNI